MFQSSDSKQAKWYSKRMVHVAAVISGVSLLVIIAVVTGFVVMAKEHQKSTRRIIEVKLKDTGTKYPTPLSFVMLNYFRTNQYEEP